MKTRAWIAPLALLSAHALAADAPAAQDASEVAAHAAVPAPAVVAPIPAIGSGPQGPFSYAMGYNLGKRVGADIKDLDVEAFKQGFGEAFAGGKSLLDDEQTAAVIEAFQQQRLAQLQAEHAKLAADNLAKSNAFLAKNGKRKGVKTTKSGLQYEVVKKGAGASPVPGDSVTAHYHGTLADGTVFDSSLDGEPVQFPLDRVILGWQEGVQLMNKGAKFKFFIPPSLGYGEQGAGEVIGPNQALVFDVELVDFAAMPQPVPDGENP